MLEDTFGEPKSDLLLGAVRQNNPPRTISKRKSEQECEESGGTYDSTASEPWQTLRPTSIAKSPRTVTKFRRFVSLASSEEIEHSLWEWTDKMEDRERTGSRSGILRVSSTEDNSSSLDGVLSFPNHGDDRSRSHVRDQTLEETLGRQIGVVLLEVLGGGLNHLQRGELVSSLLESGDDFSDETCSIRGRWSEWELREREREVRKEKLSEPRWTPSGLSRLDGVHQLQFRQR